MKNDSGNLIGHFPCFGCGGSDPLAIYQKVGEDGTKYYDGMCWSTCGYVKPQEIEDNFDVNDFEKYKVSNESKAITQEEIDEIQSLGFKGWRERKITTATCARYGVHTKFDVAGSVHYRYYPSTEKGNLVGYHVRNDKVKQARKKDKTVEGKPFFPIGKVKTNCEMFGQSLFPKGGKFLVITGGEEDAMAVYQTLKSDKYETPVISPTIGETSAFKQIQANYEYVNSFQKVVLMFDNDEAGQEAARAVTKLFGFGKIVIAELNYKDPCEYLLRKDGPQQLRKAFWEAMPKKPSQVLTVADIFERAMQVPEMGLSFPWPSATQATLGIRRGEIHIVGAAPKIG